MKFVQKKVNIFYLFKKYLNIKEIDNKELNKNETKNTNFQNSILKILARLHLEEKQKEIKNINYLKKLEKLEELEIESQLIHQEVRLYLNKLFFIYFRI